MKRRGTVAAMVLGNKFTQKLAGEGIAKAGASMRENVIRAIFEDAGERTASVSKEFTILRTEVCQSSPVASVLAALEEDCSKIGWRLCGQQ